MPPRYRPDLPLVWHGKGEDASEPLDEWEVPRERPPDSPPITEALITEYWAARIALTPCPADFVCAEGRFRQDERDLQDEGKGGQSTVSHPVHPVNPVERRAAIFIGPEFGTVQRADLAAAAREAGDAGFDVLIACAFNYEAHDAEFSKLGRIPVLTARMKADLHLAEDLKNIGEGNLLVIFGEPDIDLLTEKDGRLSVKIKRVDVFNHLGDGVMKVFRV